MRQKMEKSAKLTWQMVLTAYPGMGKPEFIMPWYENCAKNGLYKELPAEFFKAVDKLISKASRSKVHCIVSFACVFVCSH